MPANPLACCSMQGDWIRLGPPVRLLFDFVCVVLHVGFSRGLHNLQRQMWWAHCLHRTTCCVHDCHALLCLNSLCPSCITRYNATALFWAVKHANPLRTELGRRNERLLKVVARCGKILFQDPVRLWLQYKLNTRRRTDYIHSSDRSSFYIDLQDTQCLKQRASSVDHSNSGSMEEDSTPLPTLGRRKSLIMDKDGHVLNETPLPGEGRKEIESGLDKILLCQVPNLGAIQEPTRTPNLTIVRNSRGGDTQYNKLVDSEAAIIADHVRETGKSRSARAFLRAGPRAELHFDPLKCNAAIVASGSICPGLNSIIFHLVNTLKVNYCVNKVSGSGGLTTRYH
jgi:hypothetical protein